MNEYHTFKTGAEVELSMYDQQRISEPLRWLQNYWAVSWVANGAGVCTDDMRSTYLSAAIVDFVETRKINLVARLEYGEIVGLS